MSKPISFGKDNMISDNLGISGTKIILNKDTSIVRRSLWLLLVLSMTGVMVWQIIKRLETFFSNPLAVNVEIQYEKYFRFPVIIICNQNAVTVSGAYGTALEINGKVVNQRSMQKDYYTAFLEVIQNPSKVNETLRWSQEIYGTTENFMIGKNYTNFASSSHKLSNMLKNCEWQNTECSTNDFKPIMDGITSTQCHAFNTNEKNPLYTNLPGMYGAFRLRLDVQQYEYIETSTLGAGVTIDILDQMVNVYTSSGMAHHISAGKSELL